MNVNPAPNSLSKYAAKANLNRPSPYRNQLQAGAIM